MSDHRRIHFFGDYLNSLGRPCSAVEVGVNVGDYLFAMVDYCKWVTWYGVDPYTVYETFSDLIVLPKEAEYKEMFETLSRKIEAHPDRNRIKLIRKKSVDALSDVPKTLDLVYIDGNHSYESVLEDIEAWEPKVRVGGILAGHDYNKKSSRHKAIFGGLIKAVDEYATYHSRKLKLDVSGNWYWVKS